METATNALRRLTEFDDILTNYHPSQEALTLLRQTPVVLLVGPTAAGKNTLVNLLTETGRYHFIVSDTTRQKRANNGIMEQNGREYWFKSEDEFYEGLVNGQYVEAAVIHRQQVSGMHINEIKIASRANQTALHEVDINGAKHFYTYKPNALTVFLVPPSFSVWMERLKGRGHMPEDEVCRRLEIAETEITMALAAEFLCFVVNKEIHDAAKEVDAIVAAGSFDDREEDAARDHAARLLQEVKDYLSA